MRLSDIFSFITRRSQKPSPKWRIHRPRLIQPCHISYNNFEYKCTAKIEFETGGQARSLQRIFQAGIGTAIRTLSVDDKKISVYLVTGRDFPIKKYLPHLQALADETYQEPEQAYFRQAIEEWLNPEHEKPDRYQRKTNVWFDFGNGIMWTLSKRHQTQLVTALEQMKEVWRRSR